MPLHEFMEVADAPGNYKGFMRAGLHACFVKQYKQW